MDLRTVRTNQELVPVLNDKVSSDNHPVYWVFSDITDDKWENMTVIAPNALEGEFPKTYGHYHNVMVDETYKLIQGEAIMLLQKKFVQNDVWDPSMVSEVLLVKLAVGDEFVIKPEWGHSMTNLGDTPSITFDDWRSSHTPKDYEPIQNMHGMAYYIMKDSKDGMRVVANPHYKNLPAPKFVTAQEATLIVQSH